MTTHKTLGAALRGAIALLVAFCLGLLSGCQSGSGKNTLPDYSKGRDPVPFAQMEYTRPDLGEMGSQIKTHTEGIRQSKSLTEAMNHMKSARDVLFAYDTMYVLSEIHYDSDMSDDYWYDELQFCDDGYDVYNDLWDSVYAAVSDSSFSDQLLPLWDPTWDEPVRHSANSNKSGALRRKINGIVDDALDIIYDATVEYGGERLTLDEAYDHERWVNACAAWYEVYGEELLELYTQMVVAGGELARDYYRCDSYAEYLFEKLQRDYTPQMAADLTEDIVTCLLPLNDALEAAGFWDGAYDYYGDFEDCTQTAYAVLEEMGYRMTGALDLLRDYNLYYIEVNDYQYSRPYVNHLATPNVPFMFCPFYDDLMSMAEFAHEFGHFYEIYRTMEDYCIPHDLSEVHSQAMALLFAQTRENLSGDSELLELVLAETVDTLVAQSFNASIELQVYALAPEDITAEAIGQIGQRESVRYGYGQRHNLFAKYQWLTDTELFTDPLQPFCYTASAGVAVELWRLSLDDMDAALKKYDTLVRHKNNHLLLFNVAQAGLQSPFEEGWAEETADFLRGYLLEEAQEAA